MELLKQPQYSPLPLRHEVMLIYAGTRGLMDDVEVADTSRWSQEFVRYMDTAYSDVSDQLAEGKWTDEIEESLRQGINDFNKDWSS
jgi:F-type H+-transporting ATPase subunit alpha